MTIDILYNDWVFNEKNRIKIVCAQCPKNSTTIHCTCKGFLGFESASTLPENREKEIDGIPRDSICEESDVDNGSVLHFFHCFYANVGLQTFMEISDFNCNQIEWSWHYCCTFFTQHWLLDMVKNKGGTKRFTFYCHVCLESCNKLGFDRWDFWKERISNSESLSCVFKAWIHYSTKNTSSYITPSCQWQVSIKRRIDSKFSLCPLCLSCDFPAGKSSLRKIAWRKVVLH